MRWINVRFKINYNRNISAILTVTGAVIAAGSIVTKDVEPYGVVAGVRAKKIRPRFDSDIADRLLDLCWWDWPHELLHKRLKDFRALNIKGFLDKYTP